GVIELECETHDGRDRCERDVAFVPVEPDADGLAALPRALADDAAVDERRRVGTDTRRRQREARNLVAARQARQPILLLLVGAVVQQQLGGAERVRYADRRRGDGAARRQLCENHRARERRELQPAVLLRDDHCEEFVVLQELPDVRRHVGELVRDLPLVEDSAELLGRAVEERLLLGRELRRRQVLEAAPIGHAREKLAVPPDVAGFERLLLRLRHARQHASVNAEQAPRDVVAAKLLDVQQREQPKQRDQQQLPEEPAVAEKQVSEQQRAKDDRRRLQVRAPIRESQQRSDQEHEPDQGSHRDSLAWTSIGAPP